jgi:hypothetical protein
MVAAQTCAGKGPGIRSSSARLMSALGQKQTCAVQTVMSALPPIATAKADLAKHHVRFPPQSGHVQCNQGCPLCGTKRAFAAQSITSSERACNAAGGGRDLSQC